MSNNNQQHVDYDKTLRPSNYEGLKARGRQYLRAYGREALTGVVVAGMAAAGILAVKAEVDKPSHVEVLKDELAQAKADPDKVPKGKYVWYTVGEGENPTSIANYLAPLDNVYTSGLNDQELEDYRKDHSEIKDEISAQIGDDGLLNESKVLVETQRIHNGNPRVDNQLSQFN